MTIPVNQVGQPMIPDSMYKAVLPDCNRKTVDKGTMHLVQEHLESFGIECPSPLPERVVQVEPVLPKLQGETILEHFENIAFDLIGKFDEEVQAHFEHIPPAPTEYMLQSGWTRYAPDKPPEPVLRPLEKTYTFDCETLVRKGAYPVMMGAVSSAAWYIWLHPSVCVPNMHAFEREMVDFGYGLNLIGHNVGYDRIRMANEYTMRDTGNRFLDTMAMHTAVAGLGSEQRKAYMRFANSPPYVSASIGWFTKGAPKNLVDAHNFHVHQQYGPYKGIPGPKRPMRKDSKEIRDIFVVAEGPHVIHMRIHELIGYMLNDVQRTWELARVVYFKFRRMNPSWVTLAATVLMGSSLLPVTSEWEEWYHTVESVFHATSRQIESKLGKLATELHAKWMTHWSGFEWKGKKAAELKQIDWLTGTPWENDPWLRHLDWTPASTGKNKHQAAWFRGAKGKFTAKGRIAPYLLGILWQGKPIFYTKKYGWVFQVADKHDGNGLKPVRLRKAVTDGETVKVPEVWVCRIPHKKGGDNNCGNPLAKDYIASFEQGIMTANSADAEDILKDAASISYWASVRSRVHDQKALLGDNPCGKDSPIIIPQLEVIGTGTRRSVERLWLTTCSTKPNKIGSELKSRVMMPEGWIGVAADFDAQEMSLASRMADAQFGLLGSTAMGYTVMSGSKDAGTDAHSQLKKYLNTSLAELRGWTGKADGWVDSNGKQVEFPDQIDRNSSKDPGFAMIYGSGVPGLSRTFKKIRKEWTDKECKTLAKASLELRRGKKVKFVGGTRWFGGTDSDAFNYMERNANSAVPTTPTLKSQITTALRKTAVGSDYMTSRTNWVVQSSGQDMTHCVIVGFVWLCQRYALPARFLIQYHDELLTACQIGYEKKVAAALNIAHLWTQAAVSYALGLDDVPANSAFFSGTNIDTCFRKEVYQSQVSPSWDEEIPPGISWLPEDIFEDGVNPFS